MKKRTSRTFANMESGLKRPKLYGPTNRVPSSLILSTANPRTGSSGLAIPAFTAYCWWSFVNGRMAEKERRQYEEGI